LFFGDVNVYRFIQFLIVDIFLVTFIFAFRGFELNILKSKNSVIITTFVGVISGVILGAFLVMLLFGSYRSVYRIDFIKTTLIAITSIPIFSIGYYSFIINKIKPIEYIVIGDNQTYRTLLAEVESASHEKVVIKEWVSSLDQLNEILKEKDNPEIMVADLSLYQDILKKNDEYKYLLRNHCYITEIVEYWLYRIPIQVVQEYSDYYEVLFNQVTENKGKRIIDLVLGYIMMVIALPFIVLFGFLIIISSGFPVIFKHDRIGIYEHPFMFYKLRSLKVDKTAENSENPNGTITQRITWVGKILRKTRVDEFPQFINILNGSMSVVGPRPEMPVYHERWKREIPFYGYRNLVRPGITGWAQIHYGHTTSKEEYIRKTEYDLYYIKNKSILLDIQIILQTFETFLGMRGGR
jgi:lipopolysaccharide/colanic/teichoic acid biosynthesis glycosyltransferase